MQMLQLITCRTAAATPVAQKLRNTKNKQNTNLNPKRTYLGMFAGMYLHMATRKVNKYANKFFKINL